MYSDSISSKEARKIESKDGFTEEEIKILSENEIITIENLADLATDELTEVLSIASCRSESVSHQLPSSVPPSPFALRARLWMALARIAAVTCLHMAVCRTFAWICLLRCRYGSRLASAKIKSGLLPPHPCQKVCAVAASAHWWQVHAT